MRKRVPILLALLFACQTENVDLEGRDFGEDVLDDEFEPDELVENDPVSITGMRIGDEIVLAEKPAGLQEDSIMNVDLVPEWIPVGIDGEIVGYVKKTDAHRTPVASEAPFEGSGVSELPIYDEEGTVIGRFDNGLPVIGDLFVVGDEQVERVVDDAGFSLTYARHVAAWPVSPLYVMYLQNYFPGPGTVGECARHVYGTYGTVFFSNSEGLASWGGNCNAANSRPPNWLWSRTRVFSGGVLVADTLTQSNPGWATVVQTTVPYAPGQTTWCGTAWYYLSAAGWYVGHEHCVF